MAAKGEVLLLTDMRLACLAITQPLKVLWQVALRDLVELDPSDTDPLVIRLRMSVASSLASNGGSGVPPPTLRTLRLANEDAASKLIDVLVDHIDL